MIRRTVLLLFGGESSEHDVSVNSARNIYAAMDGEKYDTKLCYIDRQGKWWLLDGWTDQLSQHGGLQLVAAPGTGGFMTIPGGGVVHPDVIFPALHGKNGEDGTVQGLAKMVHVPIAGPSLLGAAVTMNKDLTKRVLQQAGIPVVEWITWYTHASSPIYGEVREKLGDVVIVKPANAGSSMGVSKVRTEEEYEAALDFAAKHDTIVLIERAVEGIEVQIALKGKHEPEITEICEIESTADFHDFDDKYSDTSPVQFHIPARLSPEQTERIKHYAVDAYNLTRCEGMARIDFFVAGDDTEYINEINSIPGFTNVSVYPKLWRATGMHYPKLIDALIDDAL